MKMGAASSAASEQAVREISQRSEKTMPVESGSARDAQFG
jgi:hypothetical protein